MTASKMKFRGRLFRVERGIRGSMFYSGVTYATRAEAEAAEARFTPTIEGHPAAGPQPIILTEIEIDPRVRRKLAGAIVGGNAPFLVHESGSRKRGLTHAEFTRLEDLGLVTATVEEVEVNVGPNRYRLDHVVTIALTPAGIAWATGTKGGASC